MKKHVSKLNEETITKKVTEWSKAREEMRADIDSYHVKLMKGNTKTGQSCYTVSLSPVMDCQNCKHCKGECYDLAHDVIPHPNCLKYRLINSLIHKYDLERYWKEIEEQIEENAVRLLRYNVGGDFTIVDFPFIAEIGRKFPNTKFLFFTKNYDDVNSFLETNSFPENVSCLMSGWKGSIPVNPHQLPEAHVLYQDGTRTWHKPAFYCPGNCARCDFKGEGCWHLKKGEAVVFDQH